MRQMLTRSTHAMACAVALVTLSACGGDADGEKTSTSTSASSASSEQTYDEDHIMTEVEKVDTAFRARDLNEGIPEDADWVTDEYRQSYNADAAKTRDSGVVKKGETTTTALHLDESEPDAPGGWYVTVYACTSSTVRVYIDGEDVSADPSDPSKPLPKGSRESVMLNRYTTPDGGTSWQLDGVTPLEGKDAQDTPCEQ